MNPDVPQERNGYRKRGTMEHYAAMKNNDFMKFIGKWMEIENISLNEVNQFQKNTHLGMHSLLLAQKLDIPKTWFKDHIKLKRKTKV